MAQVVKNPDNTLTITFTTIEQKVLQRWASDNAVVPAKQFENYVTMVLQNKLAEYRDSDGSTMRQKYDALSPAQQAQVDALLG